MRQVNQGPAGLRIDLVPFGEPAGHQPGREVDPAVLSHLRDDLAGIFTADVEIYPPVPLRVAHFVKDRGQYVADDLLGDLSPFVSGPGTVLLGITGADLFSPGMNFVFGIATSGSALISVFRLRQDPSGGESPPAIFRRRVLTEAVHELGHALGLQHCEYPGCVMYFSNWIGDTDRKGPGFCFRCARALERLMVTGGR